MGQQFLYNVQILAWKLCTTCYTATSLEECVQIERHEEADQEHSMTLGVILETLKPRTTLLAL